MYKIDHNHIGTEIATRNNCSVNFTRKNAVSFWHHGFMLPTTLELAVTYA